MLDLKSGGPEFKSFSDSYVDLEAANQYICVQILVAWLIRIRCRTSQTKLLFFVCASAALFAVARD